MTGQGVLAAFAADPLALEFARRGDLQVAGLCLAARALELPAQPLFHAAEDGPAHPGWWLRVALPEGVANFQLGRIRVGRSGAKLSDCPPINAACRSMMVDKMASKIVLGILGFPVPEGMSFGAGEGAAAMAYALSRPGPVCAKPVDGSLGEGVFPNLSDAAAIGQAVEHLGQDGRRMLIEDHVAGEAVRFFYVHPQVVGVRVDSPANLVGDGRSTIARLLERKNRDKESRTGQAPVTIGPLEARMLADQGLDPASRPESGRRVLLRQASNAALGGDSLVGMDCVHAGYIREIERLCQAVPGLRIVAVDTILRRRDQPPAPDNWSILELNGSPGMVQFRFPWEGAALDLAPVILRALLPNSGCHGGW
jgi:cyanophycin synthetase